MRALLAAACLVALWACAPVPDAMAAPAAPEPTCTPAPSDCSGWYRSDVTVSWSWDPAGVRNANCNPTTTIDADTAGTQLTCAVEYGTAGWFSRTITIRRDATPPSLTGGSLARPPDVAGWYNRPVGVTFAGADATSGIASCTSTTFAGPDGPAAAVTGTCTDNAGNVSGGSTVSLRYDATPPTVTGAAARAADGDGWFNHPVGVGFSGTDATSGVASCTSATYGGPDAREASVPGSCTDVAGNTGTAAVAIRYDATPPAVRAEPDRPAHEGWFTKPVRIAFAGADDGSGVAACDEPVTYAGPEGTGISVEGRCRDAAGNVSTGSSPRFGYDGTAPAAPRVTAQPGDKMVALRWTNDPATTSVRIVRLLAGRGSATVYRGRGTSFVDRSVRNLRTYRYIVYAVDDAGNVSRSVAVLRPRPPVYAPLPGSLVGGPTTLRWRSVERATFYNVQLLRGGVKVLSAWTSRSRLALAASWVFEGRRRRLVNGTYRAVVWPAFGTRQTPRYGPPLGSVRFTVRRT